MEVLIKYLFIGFFVASFCLFLVDTPDFRDRFPRICLRLEDPAVRMFFAVIVVMLWPAIVMTTLKKG